MRCQSNELITAWCGRILPQHSLVRSSRTCHKMITNGCHSFKHLTWCCCRAINQNRKKTVLSPYFAKTHVFGDMHDKSTRPLTHEQSASGIMTFWNYSQSKWLYHQPQIRQSTARTRYSRRRNDSNRPSAILLHMRMIQFNEHDWTEAWGGIDNKKKHVLPDETMKPLLKHEQRTQPDSTSHMRFPSGILCHVLILRNGAKCTRVKLTPLRSQREVIEYCACMLDVRCMPLRIRMDDMHADSVEQHRVTVFQEKGSFVLFGISHCVPITIVIIIISVIIVIVIAWLWLSTSSSSCVTVAATCSVVFAFLLHSQQFSYGIWVFGFEITTCNVNMRHAAKSVDVD